MAILIMQFLSVALIYVPYACFPPPGGGEPYFTVRSLSDIGSDSPVGPERQTVLNRLFLLPPAEISPPAFTVGLTPPSCPWLVRPDISAKLGAILEGPILDMEQGIWAKLGRCSGSSGPTGPLLVSATATALRGLASTCIRAALLCAPPAVGTNSIYGSSEVWERARPKLMIVRNRWASAAVKSGSAMLATRGDGGGSEGSSEVAMAAVALSTSVLSGMFAATPLIPSDEEGMRLMPARLRRALTEKTFRAGITVDSSSSSSSNSGNNDAPGWKCAQRSSSLTFYRDCAEASCKVHMVSPSPGSIDGEMFAETQADTEAAVVALIKASRRPQGVGGGGGGFASDLALARACAGLFAAEGVRIARGQGASLSSESKATVLSWTLSMFLVTGARISVTHQINSHRKNEGDDDLALCLETARLLTATAWDGRQGWGGKGEENIPSGRLVAGRQERAEIWKAARVPGVWRGLHAAVIGAVSSPSLQLCAFEVLEAAAAGWECGVAVGSPEIAAVGVEGKGDNGTDNAGPQVMDEGAENEARSIVGRLATALGGWGLGSSMQSVVVEKEGNDGGDGSGGEGVEGESGEDSPLLETVEEEAKEQQNDLERIARCEMQWNTAVFFFWKVVSCYVFQVTARP